MHLQFRVDQPDYQGPLDLLASLSHDRDLPLQSISLAEIARDYRRELRDAGELRLSEIGDFALLEARLIRLKAAWQRLLPELPDEEKELAEPLGRDPGAAIGARFLRARVRSGIFLHPAVLRLANYPREVLSEAMERIGRRQETRIGRRLRLRSVPRLQFRRVLSWLRRALRESPRVEIAAAERERSERILEFMAALELSRLGEAAIDQEQFFASIYLSRRGADVG